VVQTGQGKSERPYLKNDYRKRTWGMAQVTGHLRGKHKTLSSTTSTTKKKKKKKKERKKIQTKTTIKQGSC
jgi:hypothetical protein